MFKEVKYRLNVFQLSFLLTPIFGAWAGWTQGSEYGMKYSVYGVILGLILGIGLNYGIKYPIELFQDMR